LSFFTWTTTWTKRGDFRGSN